MKRLLRAVEVLAWASFFAFALLVLAVRFWVLPDIERYREPIVAAMSRGIGLPVRVGAIRAGWLGLRPQIGLSDVRIYDAQGREALVLPSTENVVAWRSLLHGELRLHSMVIDGPRLGVRRDAAGDLFVAGIKLSRSEGGPGFGAWLAGQGEIVVRNAEVEWRDELRGAPPLLLSALNLQLESSLRSIAVGLTARPPAELGSGIELRALVDTRGAGAGGVERPRVSAARLHRPRRLARLGGLPAQRAPGPGGAAHVVERGAGRGEADHRGPGACRRAREPRRRARAARAGLGAGADVRPPAARRSRILRSRPRARHGARTRNPQDRFPDRLAAAGRRLARRELRRPASDRPSDRSAAAAAADLGPARGARAAGPPGRSAPRVERTVRCADPAERAHEVFRARGARARQRAWLLRPFGQPGGDPGQGHARAFLAQFRARAAGHVPRSAHRARLARRPDRMGTQPGRRHGSRRIAHLRERPRQRQCLRQLCAARRRARRHRPVRRAQPRRREAYRALPADHPAAGGARLAQRRHRRRRGERRALACPRRPAPVSVHRSGERPVPGQRARGEGRARLRPRLAAYREHRRRAQLRARPHGDRRPQRHGPRHTGLQRARVDPEHRHARAPRAGQRPGRGPERRISQVRAVLAAARGRGRFYRRHQGHGQRQAAPEAGPAPRRPGEVPGYG